MSNPTTTRDRTAMLDMFLDATAGEVYQDGRLLTRSSDVHGGVDLIAYGKVIVARYNEHTNLVRVYPDHIGAWSKTVSEYVNAVDERADERGRESFDMPGQPVVQQVGFAAESGQFIGNYIDWKTALSSVEKDAKRTVRENLRQIVRENFPEVL